MPFQIPTHANFEITRMPEGWWVLLFLDGGESVLSAGPFTDRESARHFLLWFLSTGVHLQPDVVQKDDGDEPNPMAFVDPPDARLELARCDGGWQILLRINGDCYLRSIWFRGRDAASGLLVWLRSEGAKIDVEYSERSTQQDGGEPSTGSWLDAYEQQIEREKAARPDLMDLLREHARAERRLQLRVNRTLPESEAIRAGDPVRVVCPDCEGEYEARAPRFPLLPIECPSCLEQVLPVELVLAPAAGVWVLDPFYPECNARAFEIRDDEGLTVLVAFCQCGTQHGPRRLTKSEAVRDAAEHRLAKRAEAS